MEKYTCEGETSPVTLITYQVNNIKSPEAKQMSLEIFKAPTREWWDFQVAGRESGWDAKDWWGLNWPGRKCHSAEVGFSCKECIIYYQNKSSSNPGSEICAGEEGQDGFADAVPQTSRRQRSGASFQPFALTRDQFLSVRSRSFTDINIIMSVCTCHASARVLTIPWPTRACCWDNQP